MVRDGVRVPVHIAVQELQRHIGVDIGLLSEIYGNRVVRRKGSSSIILKLDKLPMKD